MKKRGLNRSYQLSGTDISLLIIAAFCSLVIVFIGYRCCKRKKGKGKRRAERRKIQKRGNHHDETGDLLNTASRVSNEGLDPEDVSAASCASFEEKPKRNNRSKSSSQNQSTDKPFGSPTILQRIMASLGGGRGRETKDREGSSSTSGGSSKQSSQRKKKQTKKEGDNSPEQEITKKAETSSECIKTHNHMKDSPPKSNSSCTTICSRTPTQDDPLNSAQLAGLGRGARGKGRNQNNSTRSRNNCDPSCQKCRPYKISRGDHEDVATEDTAGKKDVVHLVEASSEHSSEVKETSEVMQISSLDEEPMQIESSVAYDETQDSAMEVEENSGKVRADAQCSSYAGAQKDTRGLDGSQDHPIHKETSLVQRERADAQCSSFEGAQKDTRGLDGFQDQPTHKETSLVQHEMNVITEPRIESIGRVYNVMQYARSEWKSDTATARAVREGYFQIPVQLGLNNIRVIRGDNYCAIRASLFQVLAKQINILEGLASVEKIPKGLMTSGFPWIQDWNFGSRIRVERRKVCEEMEACLSKLANLVALNAQMANEEGRISHILSEINFRPREYEIRLLEAVKFLMLFRAMKLHGKMAKNEDVPLFAMIMFARDSSPDPEQFMTKHLNAVGDTGGLEQVEMHLLGYTLGVTLKVVRPSHYGQPDFIASYPDDMPDGTPVVAMVAEDDRHYNILS